MLSDGLLARVILLAGPSGAGKSRLAERTGLPVLRLDDFYKSGSDPTLPRIAEGANTGLVDWDHPGSWLPDDAVAVLETLCRTGRADVPVYDLAHDGRSGTHTVELGGAPLVVAEGIFAQEIVDACRSRGLLAAALCVRQHRVVTFWRRLTRDLREHRKPPLVLLRRGLALMRAQREVVEYAVARGCQPVTPDEALRRVRELAAGGRADARSERRTQPPSTPPTRFPQPDQRSCGAAVLVRARMLRDPAYDRSVRGRPEQFGREVLTVHRRVTGPRHAAGRRQLPWPRALGTPPWAVARELGSRPPGTTYDVRLARGPARRRAVGAAVRAVAAGEPVVLYVGSRWLPRHVVLVTGGDATSLRVYDPGAGTDRTVTLADLAAGRLAFGRWARLWFVVIPRSASR